MKPGMIIYREELAMLLVMDERDAGEAIRLLARRFLFGDDPETENRKVDDFLCLAVPKLDKDIATYEAKVSAGQTGGKQSASKRQAEAKQKPSTIEALPKQKATEQEQEQGTIEQGTIEHMVRRFTPPTLEEVKEYCRARHNNVSAERFIDHYSSNGWKVGRSSMKDWKAAVRNWERNEYGEKKVESISGFDYDALQEAAYKKGLAR